MMTRSALRLFSIILMIVCWVRAAYEAEEINEITAPNVQSSINFIFDLFLKRYTTKLIETGKTEVQIPGIEERFSTKILSMKIEGAFIVDDGWCSNISTIHRTGDADLTRSGGIVTLTAHMGLRELKIDYKNYDVSLLGVHQMGDIRVDVGENSVMLKLTGQLQPECEINVADLKIEKLDNINVDISNLGIFEGMTDDITSWVVAEVTKWYRGHVEQMIFPELAKIVKDADICHILHPFEL